jgi:uncharacterized protein (DUF433 family)
MNTKNSRSRKKTPSRGVNGKQKDTRPTTARSPRQTTKRLVREIYGGEPYEYYPLGKYIVAAPGVCGGRPTFKYTRIEAVHALELIEAGWTIDAIAAEWWGGVVSAKAIREVIKLATEKFAKCSNAAALAA